MPIPGSRSVPALSRPVTVSVIVLVIRLVVGPRGAVPPRAALPLVLLLVLLDPVVARHRRDGRLRWQIRRDVLEEGRQRDRGRRRADEALVRERLARNLFGRSVDLRLLQEEETPRPQHLRYRPGGLLLLLLLVEQLLLRVQRLLEGGLLRGRLRHHRRRQRVDRQHLHGGQLLGRLLRCDRLVADGRLRRRDFRLLAFGEAFHHLHLIEIATLVDFSENFLHLAVRAAEDFFRLTVDDGQEVFGGRLHFVRERRRVAGFMFRGHSWV